MSETAIRNIEMQYLYAVFFKFYKIVNNFVIIRTDNEFNKLRHRNTLEQYDGKIEDGKHDRLHGLVL